MSTATPSTVKTAVTIKPHSGIVAGSVVGIIITLTIIVMAVSILVIVLIRKNSHKDAYMLTTPNQAYVSKPVLYIDI